MKYITIILIAALGILAADTGYAAAASSTAPSSVQRNVIMKKLPAAAKPGMSVGSSEPVPGGPAITNPICRSLATSISNDVPYTYSGKIGSIDDSFYNAYAFGKHCKFNVCGKDIRISAKDSSHACTAVSTAFMSGKNIEIRGNASNMQALSILETTSTAGPEGDIPCEHVHASLDSGSLARYEGKITSIKYIYNADNVLTAHQFGICDKLLNVSMDSTTWKVIESAYESNTSVIMYIDMLEGIANSLYIELLGS